MNVRNAVATRDAAVTAATEPARPPLHQLAAQAIERQAAVLTKILPETMTLERFEATTLAAVKASPNLLNCFATAEGQVSLLYSVIRAAAAGLEIGGVSPEAWLIPHQVSYRTPEGSWAKRWEARLQISDRGVRDIARRDPAVRELASGVVREGDHFVWRRTLEGDIFEHEIIGASDRPLTHAYCLIRWADGGALPIVLDRAEVLDIRDRYSDGYRSDMSKPEDKRTNPWIVREAKMWAKTAIHQALRELNATPEVMAAVNAEAEPAPARLQWSPVDQPNIVDTTPELPEHASEPEPEAAPEGIDLANRPDPEPEVVDEPAEVLDPADAIMVSDLLEVAAAKNIIPGSTGVGTARKRLAKLCEELTGVRVNYPDEMDQPTREELLAKLQAAEVVEDAF